MQSTSPHIKGNPEWHLFDAEGKILGRLATQVAALLLGKHRPDYATHLVSPVHVVITNTDKIELTGNKEQEKTYYHYTGYPGGIKGRTVAEQRKRDSRIILTEAVRGMLPKNSLRDKRMHNLHLYAGPDHPHMAQVTPGGADKKSDSN